VSHDLRAPLRAIDGFARVIEEDHGDLLPAEARRAFGRIRAASQRLAVLIDDLLTLSRSVRAELRRAPVDLSALAGEIVDGLRRAEPARVVDVVIAAGLHAVADPALTRTVLENLLGNAWKYTGRVAHAHISFTAGPRAGTFEIRDDGAGFDMTYAHKLFGAFQRLHGTAEFPGNGVGLATARRILTRHGGDIEATAEVDRGATFTFWFGESSNVVS
jgi:signal transduction histidine kinase